MTRPLLRVKDLHVDIDVPQGTCHAVDGVSFDVRPGGVLGIVGESGSGKTMTAMTILGLTRSEATHVSGEVLLDGEDLLTRSESELREVRGNRIAVVLQDASRAFNPVYRVGAQIVEQVRTHEGVTREAARGRAIELLGRVGIPEPERHMECFPHQLSGGMCQRALIAMALSCGPELIIADEPTSACDVTLQAQILDLLEALRQDLDSSIILISHDLGVVADLADDVMVMYAGRVVELAPTSSLFNDPQHPYTWGLLASTPRLDGPRTGRLRSIPGAPPSGLEAAAACRFADRCEWAHAECLEGEPGIVARTDDQTHVDRCVMTAETKRDARARLLEPSQGALA